MIGIAAAFILGVAVGLFVYRNYIVSTIIGKNPTTKCDYCSFFLMTGREPFHQKEEKAQ